MCREKGKAAEAEWNELFKRYAAAHPDLASELTRRYQGELPKNWKETAAHALAEAAKQTAPQATRQSSQASLNALEPRPAGVPGRSRQT